MLRKEDILMYLKKLKKTDPNTDKILLILYIFCITIGITDVFMYDCLFLIDNKSKLK